MNNPMEIQPPKEKAPCRFLHYQMEYVGPHNPAPYFCGATGLRFELKNSPCERCILYQEKEFE